MGRREVEYFGEDEDWRVRALGNTVGVEEVAEDEDLSLGRTWVVKIGKDEGLLGHWSTAGRLSFSSLSVTVGNGTSKCTEFIRSNKLSAREGSLGSILLMSARIKAILDFSP